MAVITISRQFGAGGKTLGARIAEETGYILIDQEIIERVAMEANVTSTWVKSIENDSGGWLTKFITGMGPFRIGHIDPAVNSQQGYIDGHIYVELLYKIIPRIVQEGNCVIVGRGGQYVLQDREDAVHLLMVATLEERVKFMESNYNLTASHASKIVRKMDQRRTNLFRYFGKDDYNQPYLYDLSLNMSRIDIGMAADIVMKLLSARKFI